MAACKDGSKLSDLMAHFIETDFSEIIIIQDAIINAYKSEKTLYSRKMKTIFTKECSLFKSIWWEYIAILFFVAYNTGVKKVKKFKHFFGKGDDHGSSKDFK